MSQKPAQPTFAWWTTPTRTNLKGSYDSRIMVKPMYEDCQKAKSGKPEWHPSPPYLIVECSVPKAMHGENVYGVIEDMHTACENVRTLLQQLMGMELPHTANWTVQRVDWAESFQLTAAINRVLLALWCAAPSRWFRKGGRP